MERVSLPFVRSEPPPDLLDRCDTHVRIPMLGLKHSLNVSTAGGVVLYELLRKFRDR